jgi:hypothetical protein
MKNYNPEGFGTHVVEVTLQDREYKGVFNYSLGGNPKGFDVFSLDHLIDEFVRRNKVEEDETFEISLFNEKGEELLVDVFDENDIADFVVGMKIISWKPREGL